MNYPLLLGLGTLGAVLLGTKKSSAKVPTIPATTPTGASIPSRNTAEASNQKQYLDAAIEGKLEFKWVNLPSAPGWQVTSDAVKLDGVRFPVTARTAQQIADVLNAHLTTPLLEDLIEADATHKIVSPTQDYRIMHTQEAVDAFNQGIDEQLKGTTFGELVSVTGKSWVLTEELKRKPLGTACNYGMFRPDGPYRSISGKYQLWQEPGYRHDIDHWDYSQVLRICRPLIPSSGSYGIRVIPSHDGVDLERQPGVEKVDVR